MLAGAVVLFVQIAAKCDVIVGHVQSAFPNTAVPPFNTYTPYIPSLPSHVAVNVPSSIVNFHPSTVINDLPSNAFPFVGPLIAPFPVIVRSQFVSTWNNSISSDDIVFPAKSIVTFLLISI